MVTVDKENFPDRLVLARKARGLSQGDLGKQVRVTRSAVSFWESGKALPEMPRAELIANLLHVSVDWLLTGEGKAPQFAKRKKVGKGQKERALEIPVSSTWSSRPNEPPFDSAIAEPASGVGGSENFTRGELVVDWWRVPAHVVSEGFKTIHSKTLRAMKVGNNNIAKEVRRDDYVLIDLAQKTPTDGAIFAIDTGVGVALKRLVLGGDSSIELKDDVASVKTTIEKIKIIGRCVAKLNYL
jgi:transcriptional regulator with XRE-family HTH domain